MSILTRALRSISYQDVFGKALDLTDTGEWGSGRTKSKVNVTEDSALRLIVVYACVRLLAESVAQLPIDTFRKVDGARQPYDAPQWLLTPNFEITRFEFFERMMVSLLLSGDAYAYITRDQFGNILEVIPLNSARVRPERQGGRIVYMVTDDNGATTPVTDFKAILHIRGFSAGGLTGLSPIQYAKQTIGAGIAAEQYSAGWLGAEGDAPSSILSTDADMTPEQAKRNMAEWMNSRGGHRRPAFLSGGLKWSPVSISPDDAKALETEKWTVQQLARFYRVPPHKIGELDRATFSNIEHQGIDFVVSSLTPWLVRFEQGMRWMLPPNVEFRFNTAGFLRGDTTSRFNAYVQARNAGWLNVDEIRALEDLPPIPGGAGTEYIQPLNMGPLGFDPTVKQGTQP